MEMADIGLSAQEPDPAVLERYDGRRQPSTAWKQRNGSCGQLRNAFEKMTRIWYIARLMIMYFIILNQNAGSMCTDQSDQ